jgi:hypothetical protein
MFFSPFVQTHQAVPKARSGGWLNTMPFHKTPEKYSKSGRVLWNDTARARWALLRSHQLRQLWRTKGEYDFCRFKVQNA